MRRKRLQCISGATLADTSAEPDRNGTKRCDVPDVPTAGG